MEKAKYVRDGNSNIPFANASTTIEYAETPWWFWAKVNEKGEWTPISSMDACREGFANYLPSTVHKDDFNPKRCIYVAWCRAGDEHMKQMENWEARVMSLLNPIEDCLGWLKTQAFKIELPSGNRERNRMLGIMASRRWMKSNPLLSLHTLFVRNLIRADKYEGPDKKAAKSLKGICDHLSNHGNKVKDNHFTDLSRLNSILPDVPRFLEAYPRLFQKRKQTFYLDEYESTQGIQWFLEERSYKLDK
jgi:hypothetical protein